jgi:predicted phage terminase large subunit-like protein
MRSASNPGGVGHEWVKDRFISSERSGRVYIPATLEDNPHIDAEEYNQMLDNLDPVTRRQLRYGDWDIAIAGNLFKADWFKGRLAPSELPVIDKYVRFWDLAASEEKSGTDPDYTAGVLLGRDKNNTIYVMDVKQQRGSPLTIEKLIEATAEHDRSMYGQVGIYIEQEGGASGKFTIDQFVRRTLYGYDVHGQRVTASKLLRAKPVSAQMEHGNIKLVEGAWNEAFIRELVAFPNKAIHDDQVDALSGAFSKIVGRDWGAS